MKDALEHIAYQLKCLGNGNAATQIGAIEGHSIKLEEISTSWIPIFERIADSFEEISDSFARIADSLEK